MLGAVSLVVADFALYGQAAIFDRQGFEERAQATLERDDVKKVVTTTIVDQITEQGSNRLISATPLLEVAVSSVIGSDAFRKIFGAAVGEAHELLFTDREDLISLQLTDAGVMLNEAVKRFSPSLAKEIPKDLTPTLLEIREQRQTTGLVNLASDVREIALLAAVAAVVFLVSAVALSPRRRRTVLAIGMTVATIAAIILVALEIGRGLVLGAVADDQARAAIGAVWDGFLDSFFTWNLILAGVGVVLAVASAAVLRPVDVSDNAHRAMDAILHTPTTPWARALRAAALIAVGALVIAFWEIALKVVAIVAGLGVAVVGLSELLRMTMRERAAPDAAPTAAEEEDTWSEGTTRRRLAASGALLAGLAVLVLAGSAVGRFVLPARGGSEVVVATSNCNGDKRLCDLRVDEVTFPASHNSMSAASEPEWFFAQHPLGIRDQLDFGIRGLLIDTHYGVKGKDHVQTDLEEYGGTLAGVEKELGKEFVDAAMRTAGRVGVGSEDKGHRQPYLCHGLCELGATELVGALRGIREWLDAHPKEVLVMVIEDKISPKDTEKAFDESGLSKLVWKGGVKPLPTLRQMIDRNQRVLVMAEKDSAGVPWYHNAYGELLQETPYTFKKPSDLNCRPNRGKATNPLFLMNHWIDTAPAPNPNNAKKINEFDFLLARAIECQDERGHRPNIIAVDFFQLGDVRGVASRLNLGDGSGEKAK